MLDCDTNNLFDMLEAISLMDDEEFENTRLKLDNDGYVLKRNKNEGVDITIKKK